MKKRLLILIPLLLILSACTNWEQQTFRTLSAAKATIDCATGGYNHNDTQILTYCVGVTVPSTMYIAQTTQFHDIILKTTQAKDVAVNAMIAYEELKAAKNSTDLTTMQNNVNVAIAALTADIAQIASIARGGK